MIALALLEAGQTNPKVTYDCINFSTPWPWKKPKAQKEYPNDRELTRIQQEATKHGLAAIQPFTLEITEDPRAATFLHFD